MKQPGQALAHKSEKLNGNVMWVYFQPCWPELEVSIALAIREDEWAAWPPERVVVGGGMNPEGGDMAKVTLCVGQSWGLKGLGMEPWALE